MVGNLELLLGVSTSFRRILGVLGRGISVHRIRISYRKRQYLKESIQNSSVPSDRNPNDCAAELEWFWSETLKLYPSLNKHPAHFVEEFEFTESDVPKGT